MCNAWNHPPGCRCGWGGAGYSGHPPGGFRGNGLAQSYGFGEHRSFWYAPISGRSSYTNPNAHCPVCGAAVFYYQSEYGGRVFFDELGPPWPKHPCTDHGSSSASRAPAFSAHGGRAATAARTNTSGSAGHGGFGWQKEGWEPLVGVTLHKLEKRGVAIMQVSGQAWGRGLRVFAPHDHLNPRAPWLVRKRDESSFEFSTIVRSTTGVRDLIEIQLPSFPTAYLAFTYARKHHFGTGVFGSMPADAHSHSKVKAKMRGIFREEEARAKEIERKIVHHIAVELKRKYRVFRLQLPLADGIEHEIAAENSSWSMAHIAAAVRQHRSSQVYLAACRNERARYKLNGNPAH